MANEFLKRTPTSTGNRKVFTWSGWVKKTENSGGFGRFFESGAIGDRTYFTYTDLDEIRFSEQASSSNRDSLVSNYKLRDSSSICHVMIAVNSTLSNEDDRVKIYINGSLINNHGFSTDDPPALNALFQHNEVGEEQRIGNSLNEAADFQGYMSDIFHIDGQALTPDVFGFYKDGDGYQSSGTTKATDFRPGQWSPRAPKSIKHTINRSGGFGVNGFYLPMNDSSNPGADFHCTPNSIITLKGEDLPQPRNGAPTTSDAFVSELRDDPFAANLVLAVPGISTTSNTNFVTNGTFATDSNWEKSSQWTISGGSASMPSTGSYQPLYQYNLGLTAGVVYIARVDVSAVSGQIKFDTAESTGGGIDGLEGVVFSTTGTFSFSFTAQSDQDGIGLARQVGFTSSCTIDNIEIVELQTTVKDYSADIKGSGTNKTLTASGQAGVGNELGGYYGSAMTFDGTGDFLSIPNNSDFNYSGGEDFTIELWLYRKDTGGNDSVIGVFENTAGNRRAWQLEQRNNQAIRFEWWSDGSSGTNITTANNTVPIDQWSHICVERSGNVITVYVNGVAVGINVSVGSIYNNTADPLRIGSQNSVPNAELNANIQDVRIYKGLAKYKGGFDVPKPYTPVGIEAFRTTTDTCKNNFATLNSLSYQTTGTYGTSYPVLSNGNMTFTHGQTGQWERSNASFGVSEGKWYYEFQIVTRPTGGTPPNNSENWAIGLRESDGSKFHVISDGFENEADHVYWIDAGTAKIVSNTSRFSGVTSGISSVVNGDIINIAFEKTTTALKVWFGKNGTYFNSGNPATGANPAVNHSTTTEYIIPAAAFYQYPGGQPEPVGTFNFGQNPSFSGALTAGTNADDSGKGLFKYAPPTGFLALCEDNLPAPAIADPGKHFKTVLYTGSGGSKAITGVGFKPDFVWVKSRTNTEGHIIFDSVRGVNKRLLSMGTQTEATAVGGLNSFDDDGYSTGVYSGTNQSGQDYVAWCWKAGGATVSNTDGSITSQVSVNQTAGFSIIEVDSLPASTTSTFGHGLNKKPDFIILKSRINETNWDVYHSSLTPDGERKLYLNSGGGEIDSAFMGDTPPTSSVISFNPGSSISDHIVYCWTEIEGFSKFGSYVGNGDDDDGPFAYCGFKPAWVLIKKINGSGNENWRLFDSSRCPTNQNNKHLLPSSSTDESTETGMDFLSNGFKLRDGDAHQNQDGTTYIFATFAESPFQTANAK